MPTGPQENKLPSSRLSRGPLASGSGLPGPATAARASEKKVPTSLETLMGNLPGLVYRCRNDKDWTAEFFSAGAQLITGYPAEDFNEHRRRFADLIHPDDRDAVWDQVQAAVSARQPFTLTYRIITADRSVRWVQEHGCGVFGPDNSLLALEGFVTDITAQQKVEGKIREDEQRYRTIFAANPHPMWAFDLETLRFLAVNDAAIAHYGYSREEFMRMTVADIRPADEVPRLIEKIDALADGLDRAGPWRHRRKDGSMIDVEITSHTLDFDGHRAELVLALDVTERRRTEAAMHLQASALNAAANAIMITDRHGVIEWVNPAWISLTGYSSAEAIGENPRMLKSGAQDASFYENFWRTMLAGQFTQRELINRRKDGTLYHEHETVTPVCDVSGAVTHFIAIKQDITERKQAEADRERESSLLAFTLRSLPGIFYLYDAEGRLRRWNDNLAQATGYSDADLQGRSPYDFIAPEDHAHLRAGIEKVFTEGSADAEAQLLARDGTRTPYYFTGVRVTLDGQPHLVGVGVDITERRQAEERIRKLNRTYVVLSGINQLIVRAKEPAEILDGACRIAV
ncbi:MAG: PAS domain S-box protein, partial [Lacunisphaera sp.]